MDFFLRLARRLESGLTWVAVVCLTGLALSQGWLADGATRRWLAFMDPADGPLPDAVPVSASPTDASTARLEVIIRVEGRERAPGAVVMVNGRRKAAFEGKVAVIPVGPGDRLSIDARGYREPLAFRIVRVSPGIMRPAGGQRVTTTAGVADLGSVLLR